MFSTLAPAVKSFDDMPLPTAKTNAPAAAIGFNQIAQKSKSSSICFGSQVCIVILSLIVLKSSLFYSFSIAPLCL